MAVIDVGAGATDRSGSLIVNKTLLDLNNPANDTGTLDTFELYCVDNLSDCLVGTFYGSAQSWTRNDYESIGSVTAGSKQTFSGKNCAVSAGDIVGLYASAGYIESVGFGYNGVLSKSANQFNAGTQSYSLLTGDAISIYATGATVAAGNPYYYYLQQ